MKLQKDIVSQVYSDKIREFGDPVLKQLTHILVHSFKTIKPPTFLLKTMRI